MGYNEYEARLIEYACQVSGLGKTDFTRKAVLMMTTMGLDIDAAHNLIDALDQAIVEAGRAGPGDPRPAMDALAAALAPGVGETSALVPKIPAELTTYRPTAADRASFSAAVQTQTGLTADEALDSRDNGKITGNAGGYETKCAGARA